MTTSTFDRLCRADERTLAELFASAPPPTFDAINGFWWRGFNTQARLRLLRLRKFIKAFFRDERGDEGCNIKVAQNDLTQPWLPRLRGGRLQPFAFYTVHAQDERTRLKANPNALVIDYAATPRNPRYHIERLILDYVVQPFDDPDVLLGRAYVGVGRARMASSFFVIGRSDKLPSDLLTRGRAGEAS